MKTFKAIDVSHWQTHKIVETMVNKLGIKGIMIRAGHGMTVDEKMQGFVDEAKRLNLHYGFYWYYEGTSAVSWKNQTNLFLQAIAPYDPTLPLAIDYEEDICASVNACAIAAGDAIEKSNYFCVIYSNKNFMLRQWNKEVKNRFAIWLASWNDPEIAWNIAKELGGNIVMIQYSDSFANLSIDCDEIDSTLPDLCMRVRHKYYYDKETALERLGDLLDSTKAGEPTQVTIVRSGDMYHVS